ncbi:hypothetical protein [Mesorhizobium sp. CN2-181]|uniref:hypothetical protein n=1 Tax=Mesorhizobium yinganensis TaxID=3157707 RepID=UPI0032B85651
MSNHHRITAIALLIVIVSGLGVCAQDSIGQDGQANAQETQANNAPWSLPVQIIEDKAETKARQSREERSEQREIDDLAAQQGMNETTAKMADYALYQTILVGIGTVLLFYTLWLTSQANRAAVRAAVAAETANVGMKQAADSALKQAKEASAAALDQSKADVTATMAQAKEDAAASLEQAKRTALLDLRPYVAFSRLEFEKDFVVEGGSFEIRVKNFGRTAAREISFTRYERFFPPGICCA